MNTIPGIDTDEGLRHTGNHPVLYQRFLKRFPEDPSFTLLCHALDAGDTDAAFIYAHTLKGLTAQLGITALYRPMLDLCDVLKSPTPDRIAAARRLYRLLIPVYEGIVRQITALS